MILESKEDGSKLKHACDKVLDEPSYDPKDGKTFCNMATSAIARLMGCDELNGFLADDQYRIMFENKSGKWKKVDGRGACLTALSDELCIAALPSQILQAEHGHIAVIYPLGSQWSASFGKDVPIVANIGKRIGIMRASEAFPVKYGEPDYFSWGS